MTEEIAASERARPRSDTVRRSDSNVPSRLRAPGPGNRVAWTGNLADAADFYRQAIAANPSLQTADSVSGGCSSSWGMREKPSSSWSA